MIEPTSVYVIITVVVLVTVIFVWLVQAIDKDTKQAKIKGELGVIKDLSNLDSIGKVYGPDKRTDEARNEDRPHKFYCPGCARRFERFRKAVRGTDDDRTDVADPGSPRRGVQDSTKK